MSTTDTYLNELITTKNQLAENLNAKGISASVDEQLDELVDKVSLVHSGVEYGQWIPTSATDIFTVSGIPFAPAKIGIACDAVLTTRIVAPGVVHISLFNTEIADGTSSTYQVVSDGNVAAGTISAEVDIDLDSDGTYSVTVSFATANLTSDKSYMFKGNYEHMWVIASEEWLI